MSFKAFITGVAGTELTRDERSFLANERPWGLILFARNCADAGQIRDLTEAYRSIVDDAAAPVFIDQEGGRVQRLRPPICREYPAGRTYGRLYEADRENGRRAAYLGTRLIAADLIDLGINGDCLPLLDVPAADAHDVIGDRAYSKDPDAVADLGRAAATGLLDGGVLPVIKHIPGHGRARADSHVDLPRVDAALDALRERDFPPFKALSDMPLAMTAHVVFDAIDGAAPVTVSKRAVEGVVRGELGFDGCLMSDDVSMRALDGTIGERTRALFAAGCDLALHCNGEFAEMREVALATPVLAGLSERRANSALRRRRPPGVFDRLAAAAEFDALLAEIAGEREVVA